MDVERYGLAQGIKTKKLEKVILADIDKKFRVSEEKCAIRNKCGR